MTVFGINGGELVVLLVLIGLVVGPQRLPHYAEQLARFVRDGRRMLAGARSRVETEMRDSGADVDWSALDPRRYDPRRIVRDALVDGGAPEAGRGSAGGRATATAAVTAAAGGAATDAARGAAASGRRLRPGEVPPFDIDAT